MRLMKGKISQWKDEKGFGFITGQDSGERIFFHISNIKTRSRRPQVGDAVEFSIAKDKDNRLKAENISIAGMISPPKKNVFDYFLIIVALCSLGYAGFVFYQTNEIERSWYFAIPAALSLLLLNRQKKPKQESFSCARCEAVERFSPRTLQAWNRGITALYCNVCHSQWLQNKPRQEGPNTSPHSSSGCLGVLCLIAIVPLLGGVALYQWLL